MRAIYIPAVSLRQSSGPDGKDPPILREIREAHTHARTQTQRERRREQGDSKPIPNLPSKRDVAWKAAKCERSCEISRPVAEDLLCERTSLKKERHEKIVHIGTWDLHNLEAAV